jgi:hypothetical protein
MNAVILEEDGSVRHRNCRIPTLARPNLVEKLRHTCAGFLTSSIGIESGENTGGLAGREGSCGSGEGSGEADDDSGETHCEVGERGQFKTSN